MKKFLFFLLMITLLLSVASCNKDDTTNVTQPNISETENPSCEHEWMDADCDIPKTCRLCKETEGKVLGHTWKDATCTEPKTCEFCGDTEGKALGHSTEAEGDRAATCTDKAYCSRCESEYGEIDTNAHDMAPATCTEPSTCKNGCGHTEGEALGHSTESEGDHPKTCTEKAYCSRCNSEYSDPLGHSTTAEGDRAATCTEKAYCSVCESKYGEPLGHDMAPATCTVASTCKNGCGLTEGASLGHSWKDATYTAPKTCSTCGETEGSPLECSYWVSLVKDGVAQYTIVSSDEAYDVAANQLATILSEQTGVTFRYKTSAYQSDATGKKIVLGKSPSKILADTSSLCYLGLFSIDRGNSIHITGFTQKSALAAIKKFSALNFALFTVENANGKIDVSMPDTVLFFVDNNQNYVNTNPTILGRDLAEYKIVFPKDMTAAEKFLLKKLLDTIGNNTGYVMSSITDAKAASGYEIVFGNTKRAGSQALYAELGEGEIIIRSIDGSIYIAYDNYLVSDNAATEFHKLYLNDTATSIDLKKTPDYSSAVIEKTDDTDVRVMTSNIICAGDEYSKTQYEGVYGITWQERVNIQGEMMLLYLPDFVGLQEMQNGYTYGLAYMNDELLKTVGSEYSFVTYDGMAENTYWNPILYRHTVWNLIAKDTMYPGAFDAGHMHRWQWALFSKIDDPTQKYIVLNLHYPTARDQNAQHAAADIVNAKIRELKELYPNVPIFVTGDFNAQKTTETFKKTVANTDLVTSFDLTTNLNKIAIIDHILVPTDLAEVLAYREINDAYIKLSSDHRPVFVDISLK